jgi:hypothetical protein
MIDLSRCTKYRDKTSFDTATNKQKIFLGNVWLGERREDTKAASRAFLQIGIEKVLLRE